MLRLHKLRRTVFGVAVLAASGSAFYTSVRAQESVGFKDFSLQIQRYMEIHGEADSALPPLKKTNNIEGLKDRGQLLAGKIRELRPNAKRGEIFTAQVLPDFEQAIKATFSSAAPRATLRAGDPLHGFQIQVNQMYPKGLP